MGMKPLDKMYLIGSMFAIQDYPREKTGRPITKEESDRIKAKRKKNKAERKRKKKNRK